MAPPGQDQTEVLDGTCDRIRESGVTEFPVFTCRYRQPYVHSCVRYRKFSVGEAEGKGEACNPGDVS